MARWSVDQWQESSAHLGPVESLSLRVQALSEHHLQTQASPRKAGSLLPGPLQSLLIESLGANVWCCVFGAVRKCLGTPGSCFRWLPGCRAAVSFFFSFPGRKADSEPCPKTLTPVIPGLQRLRGRKMPVSPRPVWATEGKCLENKNKQNNNKMTATKKWFAYSVQTCNNSGSCAPSALWLSGGFMDRAEAQWQCLWLECSYSNW